MSFFHFNRQGTSEESWKMVVDEKLIPSVKVDILSGLSQGGLFWEKLFTEKQIKKRIIWFFMFLF